MTRYIIRKVRLTNFLSHEDTEIRLDKGVTAIIGENGAGKTSIVEAIYLILTGKPLRVPSQREKYVHLVRYGAKNSTISVELEEPLNGDVLRAVLRITLSNTGKARTEWTLMRKPRDGKLRLIASGATEYSKALRDLLKIAATGQKKTAKGTSAIDYAVIISQGRLQRIAESLDNPKELGTLIEEAVGIPEYRRAIERLRNIPIEVTTPSGLPISKRLAPSIQGGVRKLREIRTQISGMKTKIQEVRKEQETIQKQLPQLHQQLRKLEKKINAKDEEIRKLTTRKGTLNAMISQAMEKQEELEDLLKKKADLEKELKEAEKAAAEIPRLEKLSSLEKELENLHLLTGEIEKIEDKLDTAERAVKALSELEQLGDVESLLNSISEEISGKEAEKDEIQALLNQVESTLASLRTIHNTIVNAARKMLGLLQDPSLTIDEPLSVVEEARKLAESLEKEIESLKGEIQALVEEKARLESQKTEAEKALQALKASTMNRCPVCESPLDEERRSILMKKLEDAITEADRTIGELTREIQRLEKIVKQKESIHQQLKNLLAKVEDFIPNYDDDQRRRLEEQARELKARIQALDDEITKLEAEKKSLQNKHSRAQHLYGTLETLGYVGVTLEEAKKRAEELRAKLEKLRDEAGRLEAHILEVTGAESLEEAKTIVSEAKTGLGAAREKKNLIPRLQEQVKELEEKIASLRGELEELSRLEEELDRVKADIERLEKEKKALEQEKSRVEGEIGRLEERLKNLEAEAERLREEVKALEKLERLYRAALAVRVMLEEVQEHLISEAVDSLKRQMADILTLFDLAYSGVEFEKARDGYVLRVVSRYQYTPGEPTMSQVFQLSGGEKTSVALAFVLALNRILAGRIGFMILDEPTAELDRSRRQGLVQLLRKAVDEVGLGQLIVVTHHDEITDHADIVCTVRKEGGLSRVEGCS